MGRTFVVLLAIVLVTLPGSAAAERPRIDLCGTWEFKIDPLDVGETERWFDGHVAFERKIQVPGRGTLRALASRRTLNSSVTSKSEQGNTSH